MHKYKILLLIANHTCNNIKYNISLSNFSIIKNFVENIVIIDTNGQNYGKLLYNDLKDDKKIIKYFFINNDNYFDFGKWIFAIKNVNINDYDYILCLNDSIIVTNEIKNYFHYIQHFMSEETDLYAYNDSTQINYHYQSYLFGIKDTSIKKFINFFEENKRFINCTNDVISNTELKLANTFISKDCFLHLIDFKSSQNKNIYYCNNNLYKKLYLHNLLPIIKLKKLYEI